MVFESLVVDVLNRTLGTYVENLDASQLNLGIWGGKEGLHQLSVTGNRCALKRLMSRNSL